MGAGAAAMKAATVLKAKRKIKAAPAAEAKAEPGGGNIAVVANEAKAAPAPAPGGAKGGGEEDIPESWGWRAEPYDGPTLRQYVLAYTDPSKQEGTSEDNKGVDPNCYKAGKWYRFLNAAGECNVYIHNYTRDITANKPENFTELTAEEKAKLKRMGVFIKELPDKLIKVYDTQKQIPIVFGSAETCEGLKSFAVYDKNWHLLDATKLKKVNSQALEESRKAIVHAMKEGLMLCVYLGEHIPDFQEKVCITKNANTFPANLWVYGGLDNNLVKKKIYRPGDVENGQYVVKPGFRVCIVLPYDNMSFGLSSMRKDEMPNKIPNFHHLEQVRCYGEDDIPKLLAM